MCCSGGFLVRPIVVKVYNRALGGRVRSITGTRGQGFMTSSNVLFEEDGAFKAGTVLSDAGASLQVESASGKRTKVKSSAILLRFGQPAPLELMKQAQTQAEEIDLDFLWECAPQDEFEFTALAQDYFGHPPSAVESASLLLRLHAAPVYFYRKGRGRYRPAPPETLRAALAALERKKEQAARIEAWALELAEGRAPDAIVAEAARLLVRPDKNTVEWKALERACALTRSPAARVLLSAGAFADAKALHLGCFMAENFPRGPGFELQDTAALDEQIAQAMATLPLSSARPFSIDDSTTTEIDDCLSVQPLDGGRWRIGIHIAAPALALTRDTPLDRIARDRMSTVYMPGDKITMLPDAPIERFSLDAGREVPALSLYADLDETGTRVESFCSRLERIQVWANLRHDRLDELITETALDASPEHGQIDPLAELEQAADLRILWRLTGALSDERDRVRGKPEARHRIDFSFYVDLDGQGGETVRIVQRRRDAPLDRIVAELMILANSAWGRMLADHRIPGIYRAQQPGGRVLMTTQAAPHQGLGVAQYAWSTSPLRRYVDLLNQRQLIAVTRNEPAPHPAGDAELFAVISAFDARYSAYAEFQQRMERYWCLRWVGQHPGQRFEAVIVREDLVRLADAPLYLRMPELPSLGLAPGLRILVDIVSTDPLELTASARFHAPAPHVDGAVSGLIDETEGDDSALVDPAPALPGAVIPQENEAEPAPALQASDAESASSTDPLA